MTSRLLQRANLKGSRTGSDGVISDGGIAAGQDNVSLARYGCGAVRCGWDGEGETSIDGGCAVGCIKSLKRMSGIAERLTEQRLGQ